MQSMVSMTHVNVTSTQPEVVCRGCSAKRVVRYVPTYTFACGINDPISFENKPKGSEKDRLIPVYFPNKYIDDGDEPTS